jgi:ribosomal protein L11 methyltransferase
VIRMTVRVERADYDRVVGELLDMTPAGWEERQAADGAVEFVLYGAPGELPALPDLHAAVGGALVGVSTAEIADDWGDSWRDAHPIVDVGPLRVRAPWHPPGALDVVIDPGQAFGTGQHATTRLCLELLLELEPGGPLADWGCGSGVLAVAAARLGFAPVLACDVEPESVAATRAAAAANGIALAGAPPAAGNGIALAGAPRAAGNGAIGAPTIAVSRCDLRREPGPWAPTVTANLVRPLLLAVAARMERPPERLIASGLERHEVDEVAAAFAARGLRASARRDGGEWSALLLESA